MSPAFSTLSRTALRSGLALKNSTRGAQFNVIRAVTTSATSSVPAAPPNIAQIILTVQTTASKSPATPVKKSTTTTTTSSSTSSAPKAASTYSSSYSKPKDTTPFPDLNDGNFESEEGDLPSVGENWSKSFSGLSEAAFPKEVAEILLAPINENDVEIKPDGIIYLPEIKYRRILNRAFGPGAWGLAPRGETIVTEKLLTREYALVCNGRLVSIARGEQQFFDPSNIPTATEGCRSNALMRCCKDLGIASELWDPRFIKQWKAKYAKHLWAVQTSYQGKKKKIWMRKDDPLPDGWKEDKGF